MTILFQWINEFTDKNENQCNVLIFFAFEMLFPSSFLPALSFRSFADRQPVLSSSQFSGVPYCRAALGQQETFVMHILYLRNASVCVRLQDSCKLSRDCHICIDLLMDLIVFWQREGEMLYEEKGSWIRSTYKLLEIFFKFDIGFGFLVMKVHS